MLQLVICSFHLVEEVATVQLVGECHRLFLADLGAGWLTSEFNVSIFSSIWEQWAMGNW